MNNILEVKDLKKYYPIRGLRVGKRKSYVRAVDGVTFSIKKGTTMGLVGESGCGKTTVGRTILRLHEVTGGEVRFEGSDLSKLSSRKLRRLRPQIQMIFQDPFSSLSPRLPVGEIIGEAVKEHHFVPKARDRSYILKVMPICAEREPIFKAYEDEHQVACHLYAQES